MIGGHQRITVETPDPHRGGELVVAAPLSGAGALQRRHR
jgi:hypothetical protein